MALYPIMAVAGVPTDRIHIQLSDSDLAKRGIKNDIKLEIGILAYKSNKGAITISDKDNSYKKITYSNFKETDDYNYYTYDLPRGRWTVSFGHKDDKCQLRRPDGTSFELTPGNIAQSQKSRNTQLIYTIVCKSKLAKKLDGLVVGFTKPNGATDDEPDDD